MWAPAEICDQLRLLTRFRPSADAACPLPLPDEDSISLSSSNTGGVSFIDAELNFRFSTGAAVVGTAVFRKTALTKKHTYVNNKSN